MYIGIIDDRKSDRSTIRGYLCDYDSSYVGLILEFSSGEDFLESYAPGSFSLLFIDCYMETISGMDVAKAVRAAGDDVAICFTTSSRDYAVEGYRVRAAGYLVKPFSYEQFLELMRALKPEEASRTVALPLGRAGMERIKLNHILWCESDGHNVLVHTAGLGDLVVRESFSELAKRFRTERQFLACYRGCLVNLDQVKELDGCDFILMNGERVPVRQRELPGIARAYAEYLFQKARGEHQ